jgi:hypothetical protein
MFKFKSIIFKSLNKVQNGTKYCFNTDTGANRKLWSTYNKVIQFSLSSAFLFCGAVLYSTTGKELQETK